MINKYLMKYDKFNKIDGRVEQGKEFNYMKKMISGLLQ